MSKELGRVQDQLDLSAQDNHSKYERKYFAVVGEGTKTAFSNYLQNYDNINWKE